MERFGGGQGDLHLGLSTSGLDGRARDEENVSFDGERGDFAQEGAGIELILNKVYFDFVLKVNQTLNWLMSNLLGRISSFSDRRNLSRRSPLTCGTQKVQDISRPV